MQEQRIEGVQTVIELMLIIFAVMYLCTKDSEKKKQMGKIFWLTFIIVVGALWFAFFDVAFVLGGSNNKYSNAVELGYFTDDVLHNASRSLVDMREEIGQDDDLLTRWIATPVVDFSLMMLDLMRVMCGTAVISGNAIGRYVPDYIRYPLARLMSYLIVISLLLLIAYLLWFIAPNLAKEKIGGWCGRIVGWAKSL